MFRVMARQAGQFPHANHYPDPNVAYKDGRDVTVWCSNDYMGMSKHPEVVKATLYVSQLVIKNVPRFRGVFCSDRESVLL